ncbi:MAG: VWA domain-containing protein [Thermoproteaceae archaeon]|jgi:Ca-activated chloride channel family protein|nr:VWA domain-containing protein [Thermoproteaceae archaeon]
MLNVDVSASREGEYVDVEVKLSAPVARVPGPRVPMAFVLLIDSSKSMGEFDKLAQAVDVARRLIENMGADDVVAVYTFDEKVRVVIPLMPAERAREKMEKLNKVKAGTYTLLYQALVKAIEDLRFGPKTFFGRRESLENYIKRVIVITDGEPWPYYTEEHWYEALGRSAASYKISITAVGVGYDYNEKILYKLASASGGTWYHVSKLSDVSEILLRELKRAKDVVARRPVVRIKTEADIIETRKLGQTIASLGAVSEVELEDISAGDVVSVVFRLKPKGPFSAEVIVVTEEGEVKRQIAEENIGGDRTATLNFELAGELKKLVEGGVIQVEVLQAYSEEEGVPEHYREKARRVLEKLQTGESKELVHEATTITYPGLMQEAVGGEERTGTVSHPPPLAAGECEITCIETGKSMRVPLPAKLGRRELASILPSDKVDYISRKHLEIFTRGGEVYIKDAGSTNGIFIGGERIFEAKISPDVDIVLANVVTIKIKCSV